MTIDREDRPDSTHSRRREKGISRSTYVSKDDQSRREHQDVQPELGWVGILATDEPRIPMSIIDGVIMSK